MPTDRPPRTEPTEPRPATVRVVIEVGRVTIRDLRPRGDGAWRDDRHGRAASRILH